MLDQPLTSTSETSQSEPHFDLRQILSFLWRQWTFAGAITALVLVVGITILVRQTPLYTATAEVLLEREREKAPGVDAIRATQNPDVAMVEGELAILRSSVFLRRVVQREHLAEPQPRTGIPEAESQHWPVIGYIGSLLPSLFEKPAEPTQEQGGPDAGPTAEIAATEALKGALSASRVAKYGFVLGISVTSPDPAKAARLANVVAETYLLDKLDTRFEAAKKASAWLNDRIVELRKQLHDSEEAVSQFRGEHGLFQSGNVTLNQQQLSELNAKLVEARADAAQKKARLDLLNSLQSKGSGVANMPDLGPGSSLQSLRQQETTLSQQEADLLARYGEAHPLIVNIRAQKHDLDRAIAAETQRVAAAIRNDFELAQSRVTSLEKSLREATGQSSIDDATAIRLRELERTAAVNKTMFEDFLQRAKVTEEQSTFQPTDARIITPALMPGAPSHPRTTMFLSVNLLIGLLLGVAGARAREMLNSGFTMTKQVEEILNLPLLASVNRLTDRDLVVDGKSVRKFDYPGVRPLSRFSESIRSLRSGVHMTDVDHPPKVIQFSSAVPQEGKTTVALSVCRSAAMSKLKVLLIDADMRHPAASRIYNLEKQQGLVDLLLGNVDADEVVRFQEDVGYSILPGGTRTQTPTDLLNSERMKSLIAAFKEKFDLVVIDTPPVGPVIDPVIVSQLADKVVLVVRWGATARELVKESVQQLSGHKRIAGVVLNSVNDHKAQKYGKYAYSYYYRIHHYSSYYAE